MRTLDSKPPLSEMPAGLLAVGMAALDVIEQARRGRHLDLLGHVAGA